jgi:RNA polymerase sigma-70 factor, ECF subfamily
MSLLWPSPDDRLRDLAKRSQGGDREAFRQLYVALHDPVAGFVARRVRRRQDAEDVVSRVFFRLLERLSDFDARRGCPRMFALGIARHAVIDHLRARKDLVPVDEDDGALADEAETPLEALVHDEELRELRAALLELPAETREMLALHYGDGLKHREIAVLLGLGVGAVRQRFSRALTAIRESIAARSAAGQDSRGAERRVIDAR